MDRAVANLFKHKIRFKLYSEGTIRSRFYHYSRFRNYRSTTIQNVQRVDASLFKPFVFYTISNVFHEDQDIIISNARVIVFVKGLEERNWRKLVYYLFRNPYMPFNEVEFSSIIPEVDTFSVPDHLFCGPFRVLVKVLCYYEVPDDILAMDGVYIIRASREEDDKEDVYTPPIEMYRQDRCVVCLESTPSILYLDCLHIAVCDSCDGLKRTARAQKNCDVCRAEISKRIKI